MKHLLYHCFCRSRRNEFDRALYVFRGIVRDGLLLSREEPSIRWGDPCGGVRNIHVMQYRFCLTSLNDHDDLRNHCDVFGPIGIGFKTEFIRNLGGFPVFYLPSPVGGEVNDEEDKHGVSLVYRLAELREVFMAIRNLPEKYKLEVYRNVSDIEELEGAVRFLGNLLYFTDYSRQQDVESLRYYRQREWRLIGGLISGHRRVKSDFDETYYILPEYKGVPIHRYIEDVVVCGTQLEAYRVDEILRENGLSIRSRVI